MSRRPILRFLLPIPIRTLAYLRTAPSARRTTRPGPSSKIDLTALLPPDHISNAHKAQHLPFGYRQTHELLTYYNAHVIRHPPTESITLNLLEKFSLKPDDLFRIARVLQSAPGVPGSAVSTQMGMVRHMLASASLAGSSSATVRLYRFIQMAKERRTARNEQSPSLFLDKEGKAVWERMVRAAQQGDPECAYAVGMTIMASNERAHAKAHFRVAGEGGVGKAWAQLGVMLRVEGDLVGARNCWEMGCVPDSPAEDEMCYYYLATITPHIDPKHERLALTAAASGVPQAQHMLGVYYENFKPDRNELLAEDWYKVAATMGVGNSFIALWRLLKKQGRLDEAAEWKRRALENDPRALDIDPMAVF